MGLDIIICTDKDEEVFGHDYHDPKHNYYNQHSLSRTFCNFMCRQNVSRGEPELDQVSKITSVDILPIYEMERYRNENDEELGFFLETAENEEERQAILNEAKQNRDNLKDNIDKVSNIITALINKLATINDLPGLLNDYGHDTLGYADYFIDFTIDKGAGYIDNNFGQDLRNFNRFLAFAKSRGATTVYFKYG